MKAVLISIQPKWCKLIASGKKTIEVRKTKPKLETPFKVYIYETKTPLRWNKAHNDIIGGEGGFVIGEFVCDYVTTTCGRRLYALAGPWSKRAHRDTTLPEDACLSIDEIIDYAGGKNKFVYGWHIYDLVIYDKPKPLKSFQKPCVCTDEYEGEEYHNCLFCELAGDSDYGIVACNRPITRAPQSWCYVEELKDA